MTNTKRALISVSDKTGIVDFARALVDRGFEIVSTGGTAKALQAANLPVTLVQDVTGFPEILDGRVKTLHPKIHGGLLGDRRREDHRQTMSQQGIEGFDLVVLHLYPFSKTIDSGADFDACIENIDIGGPAMLRAAAKNHANVLPLIDADQFAPTLHALDDGRVDALRQAFAVRAFDHTAQYDRVVSDWLGGGGAQLLRYGENPHQGAVLFQRQSPTLNCVAHGQVLQGRDMSYNNYLDGDSAWELSQDLGGINAVIVKHNNPCGVARAETLAAAFTAARACDPTSAFGGVMALSAQVDAATADLILENFVEVVMAPGFSDAALARFAQKMNVRLMQVPTGPRPANPNAYRSIAGALLRQDFDRKLIGQGDGTVVTKTTPSAKQLDDLLLAFTVAKHTKSNAIILARDGKTLGIGAGQMSRVDAARIARWKAEDAGMDTAGCAVASDAFFPFADGLQVAIDAGASAVIQPGGSMRDQDVIDAADAAGLAMVFTGVRHFRH